MTTEETVSRTSVPSSCAHAGTAPSSGAEDGLSSAYVDGAARGRATASPRNKWSILFTVLIMTFMATLDSSIINVALPVIREALRVGLDAIFWIASVYLITICAVLLICGRLGDLFGKTRLFQIGVATFTVGSLLCGVSHTFEMLLVARVVQGLGAGAAMANNMGIITETFPASERGRALGLLSSFVSLGLMCGPVLGGVIVDVLPWEYIFLINVPVGALAFFTGLKTLPYGRVRASRDRLDIAGALLLAPSMALVLCSVVLLEHGLSWQLGAMLLGGMALLTGFVAAEKRAPYPLAQLSVFKSPLFVLNVVLTLISFVAIGSTEIVLPFYFQDGRGFTPMLSGLLFAVLPLVGVVAGPLSGALSDRVGSHGPCCVSFAIYTVGIAVVSQLGAHSPIAAIVASVAFMALGVSMFQPPNNSLFMAGASQESLGFVGSCSSLAQNMGMALGISGGMTVFNAQMVAGMAQAGGDGVSAAFYHGFSSAYLATAALVLFGFVLCLVRFARARRLRTR